MTDHPVKVPPELVRQWLAEAHSKYAPPGTCPDTRILDTRILIARAAQWGADQELEGCCTWLRSHDILEPAIDALRVARRPKPPTLAEQGLKALSAVVDALRLGFPGESMDGFHIQNLTAALNRLAELEAQQ